MRAVQRVTFCSRDSEEEFKSWLNSNDFPDLRIIQMLRNFDCLTVFYSFEV